MGGICGCLGGPTPEERAAATAQLVRATKAKDAAAVQKAVKAGADVNAPNPDFFNYTALHIFSGAGDEVMVSFLIGYRAKVDPGSESHETPLIMAARAKHRQVVDILLESGADTSAETNYAPPMRKSAQQYIDEM